jgi:hypothetical protein
MAKQHREASRQAYQAIAEKHHEENTAKRFTKEHALAAGYRKRAGEEHPFGSKAFWNSYTGRKLKKHGHTLPLVFSGETRARARMATIVVTTNRGQLKYQVNALNYQPWTRDEFIKILPAEAKELGQHWDQIYNRQFNQDLNHGLRFV